jgi:hypothetical protein
MRLSDESRPRLGVMISTPVNPGGGFANRRAYVSFPRKYKPLQKV